MSAPLMCRIFGHKFHYRVRWAGVTWALEKCARGGCDAERRVR